MWCTVANTFSLTFVVLSLTRVKMHACIAYSKKIVRFSLLLLLIPVRKYLQGKEFYGSFSYSFRQRERERDRHLKMPNSLVARKIYICIVTNTHTHNNWVCRSVLITLNSLHTLDTKWWIRCSLPRWQSFWIWVIFKVCLWVNVSCQIDQPLSKMN